MSLDDHVEELASDLGVDKTEVRRDLENLVSYSVPIAEAKDSLRRKYGDGTEGEGEGGPTSKDLGDVTTDDSSVTVTATVLTAGKRSIRYQGSDHVIFEGELADSTGKRSYTAWEDFSLEPGETVRIGNAGVREWEGRPELNLGERTTVERVDPIDVPYEVGGEATLSDLEPGDRGVDVEVRTLEVERKTIDGRDGETEILSGILADETARLPFTDWDPHDEIATGASVGIGNAFVREFRGAPSLNVSEFSTVRRLERTVEVTEEATRLSIREAIDSGGLFDVELSGDVIAIRDGSGLIERCPECGRVVQKGQCRSHGAVEGVDDLRVKAILDDGTGTATAVLGTDLTAEVYGGGIDAAKSHAREEMDQSVVADAIRDAIVGRRFLVRGSLSVDEYGATLNARSFAEIEDDPAGLARDLLAEVRG